MLRVTSAKRRSIRAKLASIVIVSVLCATLVAALAATWRETTRAFSAKMHQLNAIAAVLADGVSEPLATGDRTAIARTVHAVARSRDISYVRVLRADGTSAYQFGQGVVISRDTNAKPAAGELSPFSALYLGTYPVEVPIIRHTSHIGTVLLIADVSSLRRALVESLAAALLVALLAAAIATWIFHPWQTALVRPIRDLTGAMAKVQAEGRFDTHVERSSNDEAGDLVDAFNAMLFEIRTRDEKLARHRANLEAEIVARTRELAAAKAAAEAANAAKSDFLATVSHEIRTPMNGMLVMAELMATADLEPKLARQAGIIARSGQSLVAIINDVLDLSKIEAGRLELESIPLVPRQLADDVIALFAEQASAKGLALTATVAPDVPEAVLGDPVRLRQILSNLVSNAIKFTAQGAIDVSIAVEPMRTGHQLALAVRDTGMGIPADKQDKIFDAFSQADTSTTRNFGGTGIGLTICRRLAIAMQGTLRVTSVEGEGSTFRLTLPLQATAPSTDTTDAATPASRATNPVVPRTELAGRRVLAADDNAVNREVLQEALARLGILVVSVADGHDALAAFERESFDAVFLDGSMPGLDGYETARRMRAHETANAKAPTPIIALTADAAVATSPHWRAAGMSGWLTKPFTLAGLRSCLAQHLTGTENPTCERMPTTLASLARAHPEDRDAAQTPPIDGVAHDLDKSVLADMMRFAADDDDLVGRIIALYTANAPQALAALATTYETAECERIEGAAHALKSMSLNVGARRVAQLCDVVETAAQNGTPEDAAGAVTALAMAVPEACRLLQHVHAEERAA